MAADGPDEPWAIDAVLMLAQFEVTGAFPDPIFPSDRKECGTMVSMTEDEELRELTERRPDDAQLAQTTATFEAFEEERWRETVAAVDRGGSQRTDRSDKEDGRGFASKKSASCS